MKLILLCLFVTQIAYAEEKPDLGKWIKEIQPKLEALRLSIPVDVAVVKKKSKEDFAPITKISRNKLNELSYLRFLSSDDVALNQKINGNFLKKLKGREALIATTGANVIFVEGAKENIILFANKEARKVNLKSETLISDPVAFIDGLFQAMGYDGVVLDIKGSYFLVGMHIKSIGFVGAQALALANSEKGLMVSKKNTGGSALLNSIAVEKGYGLFQILLKGASDVPIGTKLVAEKSQNKPKK